ncbi:MAG TPA: glutaredoxin domain-containing protein [archaeon]|nr:glutaredoxin domain-containing protein [archaeon]
MPSVKIYTTSTCPYCVMTKQFFKANNVKYDEVNVEGNPQAQKDLIEKSGQMGVPVIDVDGKIIVGYDQPALKKALKIA